MKLRDDEEAYKVFFKYFVKCVTKKSLFESKLQTAMTDADFCTQSDEAFALLLLENSWDRWSDIYSKNPEALYFRRGKKTEVVCNVQTLYTKGGIKYNSGEATNNDQVRTIHKKGWSPEGIVRYNELFTKVGLSRTTKPKWILDFIDSMREERKSTKTQVERIQKPSAPQALHNLFNREDTEAEDGTSSNPVTIKSANPLADEDTADEGEDDEEEDHDNGDSD
jgi:hypothetical protein